VDSSDPFRQLLCSLEIAKARGYRRPQNIQVGGINAHHHRLARATCTKCRSRSRSVQADYVPGWLEFSDTIKCKTCDPFGLATRQTLWLTPFYIFCFT
jgi:hypothetical protein